MSPSELDVVNQSPVKATDLQGMLSDDLLGSVSPSETLKKNNQSDSLTPMRSFRPGVIVSLTGSSNNLFASDGSVETKNGVSTSNEILTRAHSDSSEALSDCDAFTPGIMSDMGDFPDPLQPGAGKSAAKKNMKQLRRKESLVQARSEREKRLEERSFIYQGYLWKLNKNAEGNLKDHWRRRLCVLDGVGDFKYVSEKEGGNDTKVCSKTDISACVQTESDIYLYRNTFTLSYKNEEGEHVTTFCAEDQSQVSKWVELLKPADLVVQKVSAVITKARAAVSGNRCRYQEDGFDLDLTYITKRVIAMAFPAEDHVGEFSIAIRNDLPTVKQFLDYKHKDRYMVFNLCAEKRYDAEKFDNRVVWIPFLDHNPPSLRQIKFFCHRVSQWLKQHPANVVAVHCKGGKGRTGVMVASWLLVEKSCDGEPVSTPEEAADHFARKRTFDVNKKLQGVTGLSQKKILSLLKNAIDEGKVANVPITISTVKCNMVPYSDKKSITPVLRISKPDGTVLFLGSPTKESYKPGSSEEIVFEINKMSHSRTGSFKMMTKWVVTEDYRIELYDKMPSSKQKDQKLSDTALCFRCLHTSTHTSSPFTLEADDIDKVEHDIGKHKKFPPGFNITIEFETVPTAQQWVRFNEDVEDQLYRRCWQLLPRRTIEAGETLVGKDVHDKMLYLVAQGSLRLELNKEGRREIIEPTLGVYKLIGENCFLDISAHRADVVANQDSILFSISEEDVERIGKSLVFHSICIHLCNEINKLWLRIPTFCSNSRSSKAMKYRRRYNLSIYDRLIFSLRCQTMVQKVKGKLILFDSMLIFRKIGFYTKFSGSEDRTWLANKILSYDVDEESNSLAIDFYDSEIEHFTFSSPEELSLTCKELDKVIEETKRRQTESSKDLIETIFNLLPSESVEGKKLAAGKILESARDEHRLYLVIGGSLIGRNEQLAPDMVTESYYPGDIIGLDDFILKGNPRLDYVVAGKEGATLRCIPFGVAFNQLESKEFAEVFYPLCARALGYKLDDIRSTLL